MSRLHLSSSHVTIEINAGADFTDGDVYQDGCHGIYPYADGTIDYTDKRGVVHTGVPVFAGLVPNIRGKVIIANNTSKLLIGLD